jgi:hypothetical protein
MGPALVQFVKTCSDMNFLHVCGSSKSLIGFSKPGVLHPVPPRCFQRLGHFAPLSFTADGGKIQATRFARGR